MDGTQGERETDRQASLAELLNLLDLDRIEPDIFRGSSPKDRWQRVFGGQVLSQALSAAFRTVSSRTCHSLHAYFLRPGNPKMPIVYSVDRARDGGSFSARRVTASQDGKTIFILAASFQTEEEGFEHQAEMPQVPAPESLPTEEALRNAGGDLPEEVRAWFRRRRPIDIRPVEPLNRFSGEAHRPRQIVWVRARAPLLGPASLHQCVLAYASDMTLLDASLMPHRRTLFSPDMQLASIDHALWFHRPFDAGDWLLYVQDSPSASGGRGFSRGQIFRRDGALVASVAQEGLIRQRAG